VTAGYHHTAAAVTDPAGASPHVPRGTRPHATAWAAPPVSSPSSINAVGNNPIEGYAQHEETAEHPPDLTLAALRCSCRE
jgi:hypothetical protein